MDEVPLMDEKPGSQIDNDKSSREEPKSIRSRWPFLMILIPCLLGTCGGALFTFSVCFLAPASFFAGGDYSNVIFKSDFAGIDELPSARTVNNGKDYCCERLQVIGMYNSGTNWLTYLLRANLEGISVTFKGDPGRPMPYEISPLYKHGFISQWDLWHDQSFLVEDTFFVVVVKSPAAWIRSLGRMPYAFTQTYTDWPPWTVFKWEELAKLRLVQTGKKGESGLFLVDDYDKPILMRISESRTDRVKSHDRDNDIWMVFPSAYDCWIDYHEAWYHALNDFNVALAQNDSEAGTGIFSGMKRKEGFKTSAKMKEDMKNGRRFHPPSGWHGVIVSYEGLLNDTDGGLDRLLKIIYANVRTKETHMVGENYRPTIVGIGKKSATWNLSAGGHWMMGSNAPLSKTNYEEAKKKYVLPQALSPMDIKVLEATKGSIERLGGIYAN